MKISIIHRAAAVAMTCAFALVSLAQTSRPFKGVWYSQDFYLEIDFYDKTVTDPNSMDGDPCAGIIKVKPEVCSTAYTIENIRVGGDKAIGTAYMADGKTNLVFEYFADGSIRIASGNGFSYVDDGIKKLTSVYVLSKASPFSGVWKLAKGDGTLTLNLHDKCIYSEANSTLGYGTIYIAFNNGAYVDECVITGREIKGNQAVVYYTGGRDGQKYHATLVYDPATKRITLKKPTPVGGSGSGDSYVTDGMVFVR